MKARALTVTECAWMSEECHLVDELHGGSQKDGLCLPNIFRSKKVKPLARSRSGPSYQVYYTARELLLDVLDRGAVRELTRRAARRPYGQARETNADPSEEEYAEMLTWFSIVLKGGLSVGENGQTGSKLTLKLDGWQGVLKRNSFQTSLMSLTRLEDADKWETLSAFCSHLSRRYQVLYTPGQILAVKKYSLCCKQTLFPPHLAVLCDISSGFICNMYFYSPEQLQKQSRKPVVAQVVCHLLRPFSSHRHLVQLDSSAWMEGQLTDILFQSGVNIQFVPSVQRTDRKLTSFSFPAATPRHQRGSKDSLPHLAAHLQGWTGPALFPWSDPRGSAVDVFLPGLWVTLHVICINTFVLHTLQSSGRRVRLAEFTSSLASQLAVDTSVSAPVLPRLHSNSRSETRHLSKQRKSSHGETMARNPAFGLQGKDRPGVCGLNNSGNSCYFNAVLQCLCSTVPLVEHLLHPETRTELSGSKCRAAQAFVTLLEKMWLGRSSSCAPLEARSVLGSILPQFDNHSQQDAQELLLFVLNVLNDDLQKAGMRSSVRQLGQDQGVAETTLISRLFEGRLSYTTLCTHCDHQARSTQSFTALSLPIPAGVKCSIQDCLSLFFEPTFLTGGERTLCPVCEMRRETSLLTCLDKSPEILTLHLKRFGCKGRSQVKLTTNVMFSMKLNLTPFLSGVAPNASCSSYRLYAVVNHVGHLHTGHYTALCHNTLTQTWHCFDDSAVREVQDVCVQSPDAYILLYSRRPFQKPKIYGLSTQKA